MLELLFLLLPVAAMYGWYMGVRQSKHKNDETELSQTKKIVTGIKFLLEEKHDKASDILVDLLHMDEGNFDANLALCEVYRVRGDVEKSIRIHTKLLESSIPMAQRKLVLQELAKDYIEVSLYNHASKILLELIEYPDYQDSSAKLLIDIYQKLNDWDLALKVINKYKDSLGDSYNIQIKAQFICEQAQELILSQQYEQAISLLKNVIAIDSQCYRAYLMIAKLQLNLHCNSEAAEYLCKIPEIEPAMMPEIIPLLRNCYQFPRDNDIYLKHLQQWIETSSSASLITEIANFNPSKLNAEELQDFILVHLRHNPSLRLFSELLRYQIQSVSDPKARENFYMLQSLVSAQIAKTPVYQCKKCGFKSKILFWHCPNCNNWSTFLPITGFEGD